MKTNLLLCCDIRWGTDDTDDDDNDDDDSRTKDTEGKLVVRLDVRKSFFSFSPQTISTPVDKLK